MHDPWNPTPDEVREWAYDPEAEEPCEDWDLALSWARHESALLECVNDDSCPKRDRLLSVLYLIVGNAVRSEFRSLPRPVVEGFIARAGNYRHPDIELWQRRSRGLLKHPELFDYPNWCSGGLATRSD